MNNRKKQTNSSSLVIVLSLPILFLILWCLQNQQAALILIEHPRLILPYLVDQIGLFKLILGTLGTIFFFWVIIVSSFNNNHNVVRGAKIIPRGKLGRALVSLRTCSPYEARGL